MTETGISQPSVFNSVPSFHVTNNLAVDIMHDLYEGVCHYDLSHILSYLFEKKYLTLCENERKSLFDYGSMDIRNISQPIDADHISRSKFNTLASEMRCLIHYITLIIGEKVPPGDVVWHFLTNLVNINFINN